MPINFLFNVIFERVIRAIRSNQTFERVFTFISHFANITVYGIKTFEKRYVLFKVLEVTSHHAETLPNETSKTTDYSEDNIKSDATILLLAIDITKLKASLKQWTAVVPDIIVAVLDCS
jgi:hypothetical protein